MRGGLLCVWCVHGGWGRVLGGGLCFGVWGYGGLASQSPVCTCVGLALWGCVCWRCDVYREVAMRVLQVSLCDPESTLKKHFPIYGLYEIVPNSLEKLCQD